MASDPTGAQPLQFDTTLPNASAQPGGTDAGVTCTACQRTLTTEYYDVNGQSVCESCRDEIAKHADTPRGWGPFARAVVFGVVAACLGAILYYAVIAITNFEIGIVAIAIGYMVGYAVRMATAGRGGRRFQVLAIVLTYWAVGLAYTPLVFQGMSEPKTSETASTAGTAPTRTAAPDTGAEAETSLPLALVLLLAFSLALPVMSVLGSMPSGLISAAIIAFGIQQAWRMTGVPELRISGPYSIASGSTASA